MKKSSKLLVEVRSSCNSRAFPFPFTEVISWTPVAPEEVVPDTVFGMKELDWIVGVKERTEEKLDNDFVLSKLETWKFGCRISESTHIFA